MASILEHIRVGPVMIFCVEKENASKDAVARLVDAIAEEEPTFPIYADVRKARRVDSIVANGSASFSMNSDRYDGLGLIDVDMLRDDAMPKWRFSQRFEYFAIMGKSAAVPEWNADKQGLFVEKCIAAADALSPVYGWGDWLSTMLNFENLDPRQYVFGFNYFGRDIVEKVGRDALMRVSEKFKAWKVLDRSSGAAVLVHSELPFNSKSTERKKIASMLKLTRKLGELIEKPAVVEEEVE